MLKATRLYIALFLVVVLLGVAYANPGSEWVSLSSDSESELKQKIKSEVEKRDDFSTAQEDAANLRMVEEEKSKEDSSYKSAISQLIAEFNKYKKSRDEATTKFQADSTEFEELQKETKNIKTAIENCDSQILRFETDIKLQQDSFTKWLKTEKQGEAVVAVIYTRGLKDAAHALDKEADMASMPLMAAFMGTYVKSHSTVINSVLVRDVIQGTEEGTAKWNGEEPVKIELAKGSKGTVYLRIKRYELYPFQAPEGGKVTGNAGGGSTTAAIIQSGKDLEEFLSKNGYAAKNLDLSRIENIVAEAVQFSRQAESDLSAQSGSFEEKIARLNEKITNAKSDKELQLSAFKKKEPAYKKMEAELDALRKKKDEAEKLLNEAQSRLSDKKHTRETIIVKTAIVTPKGAQTPAEAVAEMVMDKLSEVKNDARVQHSSSTITVVNSQFAGETGSQAVTEAKIKGVRLISFINEGDSVKVKMAFRVKTVLSDPVPSGGGKVPASTPAGTPLTASSKGKETGMVFVKGGCFEMGDTFGGGYKYEKYEKPVHTVCVDDFYLGKYEVTVGEFRQFVNSSGYQTEAETGDGCYVWTGSNKFEKDSSKNWKSTGFSQSDKDPVACVSWNDADKYIEWQSKKDNKSYRLPTEAEWEYAARSGGKKEKFAGASSESELEDYAWYMKNSGNKTHPIGQKRPNGLGIYDMIGNVWEWTGDWYDENYYGNSPKNSPTGPSNGRQKVIRGGSWYNTTEYERASNRTGKAPTVRSGGVGFRVASSGQ